MDVGEAVVAAAGAVGQFLVIDAEQMQHRGPEVVDRVDVFDGVIAELIGGAVNRAGRCRRRSNDMKGNL